MSNHEEHDMTKKMLSTIRGDKTKKIEESVKSESLDESTRSMLNKLREGKMLNENENEVIELEGSELKAEHDKFRDTITSRVEFTVFNIYPDANNVVFGGKFLDMDGAEWQMTLEENNGVYITASNMQLTPDVVDRIQKLVGFYDSWADEWSTKLATEYKQNL